MDFVVFVKKIIYVPFTSLPEYWNDKITICLYNIGYESLLNLLNIDTLTYLK